MPIQPRLAAVAEAGTEVSIINPLLTVNGNIGPSSLLTPKTREEKKISKRNVILFKASKEFKELINKKKDE